MPYFNYLRATYVIKLWHWILWNHLQVTCFIVACTDNTFGNNCTSNCSCVRNNTVDPLQSCDRVTGMCSCTKYWNGSNCETDIDECVENKHNCTKPNERCNNLIGGYSCSCLSGYQRHVNGSCFGEHYTSSLCGGCLPQHSISAVIKYALWRPLNTI
jgi:hypothetical protein